MSPSSQTPPLVPVPIPDRIAGLIGSCMPPEVMAAEEEAFDAAVTVSRCRTPYTTEARERALSELHRHNKIIAKYDPRLIVTSRGAS